VNAGVRRPHPGSLLLSKPVSSNTGNGGIR
jgi:hypothetical protein